MTERRDGTSFDRQALLALRTMRLRLEDLEQARNEPIAIVGIGCRFPGGVNDPDAFWRLLRDGIDAIAEVPADRWDVDAFYDANPDAPGKMYSRWGGFVHGLDTFDPQFFGISPREADGLDPQQRLLLEVSWEALERAGLSAEKLAGSPTGVFVGIGSADFSHRVSGAGQGVVDAHFGTGTAPSVAAGRLSYFLGLNGPCLAVDTACSSSLVAVHLASQSLRNGECRVALAGGVNVLLWPELTVAACKARMLARDGRCKTFDDAADGYVRGEGCGIIVLKRLRDAVEDGDTILALIRATAVNQDGRTSGLTVPNGPAQQAVIEQALKGAGIRAADVTYVEAHGTGTSLGDPIELRALGGALCGDRPVDRPLLVGSVKTNIGHLEAAAGIASLIKVVLALGHGEVPPHLHLSTRNRHVNWDGLPIAIPDRPTPWNPPAGPRIAGVSSFGFSGTNAHAILEQAPAAPNTAAAVERPVHLLALSAKTRPALVELARAYTNRLNGDGVPIPDLCYTANAGRSHFSHRLAVMGASAGELRRDLAAFVDAPGSPSAAYREAAGTRSSDSEVVFLFSAGEPPDHGIARSLCDTQAAFRVAFEQCQSILGSALSGEAALFAFEYALASVWQSWGIKPGAVLGNGVGQHVASCLAGAIALPDALHSVATRAATNRSTPGDTKRLRTGIEELYRQGFRSFLEVGPSSDLAALGRQMAVGDDVLWVASLEPGTNDWRSLLSSLRELYLRGVRVDWDGFDHGYARRKIAAPTYPFERERCWVDAPPAPRPGSGGDSQVHPLLGTRVRSPLATSVFESHLAPDVLAFLADHRVNGNVIAPASVMVELALAASTDLAGGRRAIRDLTIEEPLALSDGAGRVIQTVLSEDPSGGVRFAIYSGCEDPDRAEWARHAGGTLKPLDGHTRGAVDLKALASRGSEASIETFYSELSDRGLQIGEACRAIVSVRRGDREAFGEVAVPGAAADDRYSIHPVLLDACCHVAGAAFPAHQPGDPLFLLIGISRFDFLKPPASRLFCHAAIEDADVANAETVTGSMRLIDETGGIVAIADGMTFKRARRDAMRPVSSEFRDWLYELQWQPKPRAETTPAADYLTPAGGIARAVGADPISAATQAIAAEGSGWLEQLERLATHYVAVAFADLGWRLQPGQRITSAGLAAQLGVRAQHTRLLDCMLSMLQEDQVLARDGDEWIVLGASAESDRVVDPDSLARRYPSASSEFRLLARCGEQLARVLRGETDPLQLLFLGGSSDELTYLYRDSPRAKVVNERVQQVVRSAIAGRPDGRAVRVLEVGGGTGSATASVLPILPPAHAEYVFTDVSVLLVERAAETFKAFPFVQFRRLDIERSPAAQGFDGRPFDMIIAANVVHATRSLHDTVAHLRQMLAPSGLLVLVEATQAHRWLDLTFGLTDGWWRFDDRDVRRAQPLLTVDEWRSLLSNKGFVDLAALPAYAGLGGAPSQSVIAATNGAHAMDPAAATRDRGTWIVLADASGLAERAARELRERGYSCAYVRPGTRYAGGDGQFTIDPGDRAQFDRVLHEAVPAGHALAGLLHLWSVDRSPCDADPADAERLGCGTLLRVVQMLADNGRPAPIWIATRGAQAVEPSDLETLAGVAQAPVWGFARGLAVEHPELWGGIVDLDHTRLPAEHAARLVDELTAPDGEDQIAFRGNGRLVLRLERTRTVAAKSVALMSDAAYLVTGGMGGLGLRIGEWMARRGARHITLLGRRGFADADGAQRRAIRAIEDLGATVDIVTADVSSIEQMRDVLARYGTSRPPLRGIVHAAADISAERLREMTPDRLTAVLRPKVAGTLVLDALTADLALDFFVLFSSTTGLLGSADLAHYAAANAFLDAFSHYRRRAGRPAVSICWGAWDRMRAATSERSEEVARGGLLPMPSPRALSALGELLAPECAQAIVASIDWSALKPLYETKRRRPMLERLDGASRTPRVAPARTQDPELRRHLDAASAHEREALLRTHIRAAAGRVLRLDPARLDIHRGLFDLGMDSLMSVELKNRLETAIGCSLPASLTFNHPSVEALTRYVGEEVLGWRAVQPIEVARPPAGDAPGDVADDDLSEDDLTRLLAAKLESLS